MFKKSCKQSHLSVEDISLSPWQIISRMQENLNLFQKLNRLGFSTIGNQNAINKDWLIDWLNWFRILEFASLKIVELWFMESASNQLFWLINLVFNIQNLISILLLLPHYNQTQIFNIGSINKFPFINIQNILASMEAKFCNALITKQLLQETLSLIYED